MDGKNMSVPVPHLKLRVFAVIITMFFLWQALKLIPWMLNIEDVEANRPQPPIIKPNPILVTVFYEALCPDSKSFITRQLLPSYEKAPALMAVSFIPYGKANTVEDKYGNISFTCQHGPVECQANKIHACAINHISDSGVLMKYISCMITDNINPEYIARECGRQLLVNAEPIIECGNSKKGTEYLQEYGQRTVELVPSMSFVPTVLLNHELRKQTAILKNLFYEVCITFEKLPSECIRERAENRYR